MSQVMVDYTRQDARARVARRRPGPACRWRPPPAERKREPRPVPQRCSSSTTPCWWRTTTSTATCRTWHWKPAAASPIRWRWRASAATMPRRTLVVAGVRFMGETVEDPVARQARADARPRSHLFARPRLSARRLRALLRRPPRAQGRGLCQHQRRGEGARRLDGDQFVRAGDRAAT